MSLPSLSSLLRRYLAWRLLLPASLLILGTTFLSGGQSWLDIQRAQRIHTLAISEYVSTYLSFSTEIVNLLAETSSSPVFPALAAEYLRTTDALERILLLTKEGEVLDTFPPLGLLKDYSSLIAMQHRGNAPSGVRISSPYLAPLSNHITASLFSRQAHQRMVVGELNLASLQTFISGLGKMEPDALVFITDGYGTLVAHPDSTLVSQQTNLGSFEPVTLALRGKSDFLGIHRLHGRHYLFSAAPALEGQWVVFTAWSTREKFLPVFTLIGALSGLFLLLLATTVWVLKRNLDREVSGPLALFARAMDQLKRGDQYCVREIESLTAPPFQELHTLRQGFLDMNRAISNRENTLRLSEERFRNLTEDLPESVFEMDLHGRLIYVNHTALSRFGYTRQDIDAGLNLMDLAVQEERNLIFNHTLKIFRDESGAPLEFKALCHNGETFPAQLHASPLLIHDRPCGLRGFIVDMTRTRMKHTQRLEMERRMLHSQKLESLGILAGGIAHDFNNLLTAIQGNLDLAATAAPQDAPAACRFIHQAGLAVHRATDLTRQILAYSGKGQFSVRRIELNGFIRENMTMLQAVIAKTITLHMRLSEEDLWVMADPGQLQQVFINLITNASESMEGKPGEMTIRTGVRMCHADFFSQNRTPEKPGAGRFAYLIVEDSGCGMDGETLERLFEPFFTSKFTGRGLGLSAVLGIVHGHRGAIMVESTPEMGSTFQVYLPSLEQEAAAHSLLPHEDGKEPGPETAGGLVLVVDDEEMIRDICTEALQHMGCSVLSAADGEEGLRLFMENRERIACVMLDLTMPRMDGLQALRAMREIRPEVRVILSSGYNAQEAIRSLLDGTATRFLKKPFSIGQLQALFRERDP